MEKDRVSRDWQGHALIRARLMKRLGESPRGEVEYPTREGRVGAAADDIRNALVPVRTIAELLSRRLDAESGSRYAEILNQEVDRIVYLLDEIS
jgi:nitrogen-specific signal transduction histidine kinase